MIGKVFIVKEAVKLPIEQCDLTVRVGSDGVWLEFGKYAAIHVHNVLGQTGLSGRNISEWCLSRQKQAEQ